MGQVWSAVHVVTGRRVAIKRLLTTSDDDDSEGTDSQARARFMLEAQAACAVEHPNVVEILDFIEPGNEPPLLVMELLQGETLAAKLTRENALGMHETASLLLPVVSAVGTAHARGIIHRDLKPANIFLSERSTPDRMVKVLDFGIAKWIAQRPDGAGLRTQTGSTLGTPCYMAPEQAIGERLINHTVDIWSLGVILYECLSGGRPVEGENAAQVAVRLLNTGIIPLERVVPTLPADVTKLVDQMLSRDPTRRPADLRQVFDVLRGYTSISAPAFAGPALESLAPSDVAPEGARASSPAVAWVPKTQPERSAVQPSATLLNTGLADQPSRRRARWVMVGVAAVGMLIVASRALRRNADYSSPSEPRNAPAAHATNTGELARQPPIPTAPTATGGVAESPHSATGTPTVPPLVAPLPAPNPAAHRRPASVPQSSAAPPAAASTVRAPASSAPAGASCERSRDCASRLCVAFVCE
jgi:serine/threonine-protein kinase